ncbi:MAG: hypothetical protein Q8M29_02570 [Bacteroidota bacterium]|nr:hypothetical protein [Bacteroidota bacterium]
MENGKSSPNISNYKPLEDTNQIENKQNRDPGIYKVMDGELRILRTYDDWE